MLCPAIGLDLDRDRGQHCVLPVEWKTRQLRLGLEGGSIL